jgi:hypothetical protein
MDATTRQYPRRTAGFLNLDCWKKGDDVFVSLYSTEGSGQNKTKLFYVPVGYTTRLKDVFGIHHVIPSFGRPEQGEDSGWLILDWEDWDLAIIEVIFEETLKHVWVKTTTKFTEKRQTRFKYRFGVAPVSKRLFRGQSL